MKKRILSILLALCMLFCLVPTTAFAADCAEDLVDPVIWIHLSSDGGGYYDVLNGTWTAADFFQPGKAPKGAKITAVMPPTSPSIPVSVNVNSDGTLNCTKTENTTEPVPKSETYTVTITSDDYAPISAPLTVRQYLNAGFRGPVYFDDELLYGDTYTYTCRVNNPGENGVWSALIQDPQMFEIYKETTDTTSEPGKSIYTVHIRAIKAGARVTCIDFLYVSDTTMASSKVSRGAVTGGAVRTRPLTVTAGSATITEGNALPTDLVTCTGLLNSEGRKDDRDTVLDNALGYQLLDANNEEVTAATARNMPGTYTVVPAATLKSGWGERYSLNKVNGTLTVENQPDEQFTLAPGGRYYFDLSAMNIPGTVNSNLPDSTLHYVPFTYVGTVNAYKLTSAMATTEEYAQQNKYAHSLFVADYAVTLKVNWNNLDTASLIFGKNYASGGVDYTLRAPSVGSGFTGSDDSERGTPQSNEWDAVLDKNSGYVKNWNDIYSWGQDTSSYESWYRAVRGSNSARYWSNGYASTSHPLVGFRPVLEVLNTDPLISDSDRNLGDKNQDFTIEYTVNDSDSGDVLTATESIDGRTTKSFAPTRNFKNTITVNVRELSLGPHTVKVVVTDGQGGTATRTWTFNRVNSAPTISGTDTNLGDKNIGFTYNYTVNDADGDAVTVVEMLNDETLRTINNAPKGEQLSVSITSEKLYALGLNTVNNLVITATDGQGGTTYRRLTFKRTNSAPAISGQDEDLGQQTGSFAEKYTVTDVEGDNVVVTEFVDNKQIRSYQATLGQEETIELSRENWLVLANGDHQLRVEAVDGNFATSVRVWNFSKKETVIAFQFAQPEETDARATKILITPTWHIEGSVAKVEACNNAFDASPAWEDITAQVAINRVYNFLNQSKTAEKWGVNVRFTIEKNEGYEGEVSISGFGGAYE